MVEIAFRPLCLLGLGRVVPVHVRAGFENLGAVALQDFSGVVGAGALTGRNQLNRVVGAGRFFEFGEFQELAGGFN